MINDIFFFWLYFLCLYIFSHVWFNDIDGLSIIWVYISSFRNVSRTNQAVLVQSSCCHKELRPHYFGPGQVYLVLESGLAGNILCTLKTRFQADAACGNSVLFWRKQFWPRDGGATSWTFSSEVARQEHKSLCAISCWCAAERTDARSRRRGTVEPQIGSRVWCIIGCLPISRSSRAVKTVCGWLWVNQHR